MLLMKDGCILIIGLGLIGGSIAKALVNNKKTVFFIDIFDKKTSLKNKTKYNFAISFNDFFKNQEINTIEINKLKIDKIIICIPLRHYDYTFEKISKTKNLQNIIITDIGSVKDNIIKHITSKYPNIRKYFIPSHPIAGREVSGYENSDSEILHNKKIIICPTKFNLKKDISKIQKMWESLKMSSVFLKPQEHDEIYACVSHLPQFISFLLSDFFTSKQELIKEECLDFLRLTKSPRDIWDDIFIFNNQFIAKYIVLFLKDLEKSDFNNQIELCYAISKIFCKITKKYQNFGGSGLKTMMDFYNSNKNIIKKSKIRTNYKNDFVDFYKETVSFK